MRHIELVLTDLDIEVNMAVLAGQRDTLNEMITDGRIAGGDIADAKKLANAFNSLWHKFNWALNPKQVKNR